MTWWDNLVGAFWILLQSLLWLGAIALVGLVVVAIVMGVYRNIRTGKEPAQDTLMGAAEAAALSRYRNSSTMLDDVDVFVQGADYMYGKLHPKKKR